MSERLARILDHPLRRRLLFEYTAQRSAPAALARQLGEPLNLVAYHTGVLAREGLIELVHTERRRGALTRTYRASVAPAIDGPAWEALSVNLRRALTLGALEQALTEARNASLNGGFDGRDAHLTRTPMLLDPDGVAAVADALRSAFDEIAGVVSAAAGRSDDGPTLYEVVMLAYERPPPPP